MEEPWFAFGNEDSRCGEDIFFCVHAKEQGIKIWLDPTYQLGHVGDPQIIGRAQYERYVKDHLDPTYQLGHVGDPQIIGRAQYERYVKDHEEEFGPKIKVGLGAKNGNSVDRGSA
jgi:hypothetical protein